ncbi:ABC transporter ATP-binding protein [Saxibacter everestensis]|uniref:ABC transporter ATP-binding protein n=1 Tax=Saxibacter everestensis TaxID=2909229 RepID=A0ABY8QSW3_9MICO|nr:ABC transporter ATP-binding protein [Brevibacteriaceae bacterium ZFBP1038]
MSEAIKDEALATGAAPSASQGAALTLDNVSKNFGTFAAVKGVSIDVRPGEFVTFLGPSGSGKTTSLNMIAGFETPSAGDIRLDDRSLVTLPISRRNIGMVFQGYALFPHMSVEDNIGYPLKQRKVGRAERQRRVTEVLDKVNLEEFRKRMPAQLSGGQRQRVALARAIAYQPPLLLMDEPLSALDKGLRERLQHEIRSIHQDLGTTVVYVTHDQDEALALSDRIVVFNEGRTEQTGTPAELYAHPDNLFVAKFLGESLLLEGEVARDGGGSTVFRTAAFQIPVENPRALDGRVRLMVRPEKIGMADADGGADGVPSGHARVPARVESSTYLGHTSRYAVTVGDAGGGIVRIANDDPTGDAAGRNVSLTWAVTDAILLPDTPESSQQPGE